MRSDLQRGSTLIEVLFATGVMTLLMVAIAAGLTAAVRNSARAQAKAQATQYTQEGLELFRQQRAVMGFLTFANTIRLDGTTLQYCLATLPSTPAQFTSLTNRACNNEFVDAGQIYTRSANVTVVAGPPEVIRVISRVTWSESGVTRNVEVGQEFRDIQ
jgi:type II secretory pathway pseudopilin PulG